MILRATELPFYIDTVGTITATALGGTVPGILTAFVTNAVNFFMDGESIFYAPLNMLIAIMSSAYFGELHAFKKQKKQKEYPGRIFGQRTLLDIILYIMILAIIGGGIGGQITWYLYGTPSEAPISVNIYEWLADNLGMGSWGCHMVSTYITDFIDKSVSVIISLTIIGAVPKKVKEYVRLSSWRQKAMSYEEQLNAKKKMKGKLSLGVRINIVIILSTLIMTIVALVFFLISFRENTIETLSASAAQITYLAAREIDPDMVEEYLKNGTSAPGYLKTRDRLSFIMSSSSDIAFLYVYKIEEDGCHVVFDLDTRLSDGTFVPGDPPGMVVGFEEAYKPFLDDLLAGRELPPMLMSDDYGSFVASYHPVYDVKGRCVCYVVSNVESGLIDKLQNRYFGRVVLLFAGFLLLIVAIGIITTKYHVVLPIIGMTMYSGELTDQTGGVSEESLEKIDELDIHTGDEMELLYRAICKLTKDTVYQLNDNRNKTEAISRMQNALIITMADMVESRDSDTGAHVLKTAAYVRIILQGLKRNGYYAEKLSDRYMRDVEMSAPLHDVGKINIPDAILNKPGKLTDEEFEIMKTHTTAGRNILDNAISSMEGDNYLKEARNMAVYHHERWDGKGYPEGLHGEVIPLSARIMAVADVFDALSSPRVYKPAFPFDEAMKIITDGAGKQFDPKCVEVFAESMSEVKSIYKKYQEIR
jgi:HD-GYP domain-containing protein (c-di-GMP phosphodiesterase class II)